MPYKSKEDHNRRQRERRREYRKKYPVKEKHRLHWASKRKELKLEVLTHYGPNGLLGCCWEGCPVVDLDMLSLDHINDDGCKQRREDKTKMGTHLYRAAKKTWPLDLQTLCMNHQFKKRAMRPRSAQGRPNKSATDIGL